jgi:hypothetical protein
MHACFMNVHVLYEVMVYNYARSGRAPAASTIMSMHIATRTHMIRTSLFVHYGKGINVCMYVCMHGIVHVCIVVQYAEARTISSKQSHERIRILQSYGVRLWRS